MTRETGLPSLSHPDASLHETLGLVAQRNFLNRRRTLRVVGAALIASPRAARAACSLIPAETAGPFPGDGTNGPNVLTQSGIVRSDIRARFGSAGTTGAAGTPLTVTLQIVNVSANCAPREGYAVYLWHCDAQGRYSLYSAGAHTQNYLRGVQVSDAQGRVAFTTIYPGAYPGRWPHMHFEIYESSARAVSGRMPSARRSLRSRRQRIARCMRNRRCIREVLRISIECRWRATAHSPTTAALRSLPRRMETLPAVMCQRSAWVSLVDANRGCP